MFKADIELVTAQIRKYGLRKPMADLGGLNKPTIADYALTIASGDQQARYLKLPGRPFDDIDPTYVVLNPEQGDLPIEELPAKYSNHFGTAVCLNVIEHVVNPFEIFNSMYALMQRGGLVIITTVFSFPEHKAPIDFWRYSPDCLKMLGEYAGFEVLERGFHLVILADAGVKEIHSGEPQEVRATFVTVRKPK